MDHKELNELILTARLAIECTTVEMMITQISGGNYSSKEPGPKEQEQIKALKARRAKLVSLLTSTPMVDA